MDGAALTSLRTPAVSALGVDLVAPADAGNLVVFGCGPQAFGHVFALRAIRPVRSGTVVGRDPDRTAQFVDRLGAEGVTAVAGAADAVAGAALVACCTTAKTPLFDGRWLPDTAVVVAVGSHEPTAREVDTQTVRRCGVLVESRAAATTEAGDVMRDLAEGAIELQDLVTFSDVVCGRSSRLPRLVKTVGMGWEDLVIAGAVASAITSGAGLHR
jgi:ornithine cyclodeaminase